MALDPSKIDRLLGNRPHLGVGEKEATFERIWARTAPSAAPSRLRWVWAALAPVALASIVAIIWASPSGFASRAAPATPGLSRACVDASDRPIPCVTGGRLVFSLEPAGSKAFGALALAPDGRTLWYFPAQDDGTSLALAGRLRGPAGI